jgi:MFS family permease
LAIAGFLPVLAIIALAPAVPSILSHFSDVPYATTLVPLMVTAPGLMVALLAPFAGPLVDRFGRRRLILLATFAYGFTGTAPFFLESLPAIFVTRFGVGVSEIFIIIIVNALFADYFDTTRRRTWITVQGVVGPALGTLSIISAGALTATYWNGGFLVYAVAFLIFVAMLLFFFEPKINSSVEASSFAPTEPFPKRTALFYCGVTLFASIIYYAYIVQSGLAFEAAGISSSSDLGFLIGLIHLGVPVGAIVFNVLSRRLSGEQTVAVFLLLMGLGIGGMGFARDPYAMAAFGFLQQIGAGVTVTGLIFWVSQLLPPAHRGRGFGYWTSAFFAGQFLSPLTVGAIRGFTDDILSVFVVFGAIALTGSVLMAARAHLAGRRVLDPSVTAH